VETEKSELIESVQFLKRKMFEAEEEILSLKRQRAGQRNRNDLYSGDDEEEEEAARRSRGITARDSSQDSFCLINASQATLPTTSRACSPSTDELRKAEAIAFLKSKGMSVIDEQSTSTSTRAEKPAKPWIRGKVCQ